MKKNQTNIENKDAVLDVRKMEEFGEEIFKKNGKESFKERKLKLQNLWKKEQ